MVPRVGKWVKDASFGTVSRALCTIYAFMKSILIAVLSLGVSLTVFAEDGAKRPNVAVGVELGTTGAGASLWVTASKRFDFTVGYGALSSNQDYSTNGVDYLGSVELSNGFATAQWHPTGGSFHFLAGVVFTENSVRVVGSPQDGTTYELDGVEYPASLVGSIIGNVGWDKSAAPYFGIGFSKRPQGKGWGAYINAGVMESGSAVARLEATGAIADQSAFQDDLRAEEQALNDELSEFELFPVVRAGLMYRF